MQPTLDQRRGIQNLVIWTAAELSRRGWRARVVTAHCDTALWARPPDDLRVVAGLGGQEARRRVRLGPGARTALHAALSGGDVVLAFSQPAHSWIAELAASGLSLPPLVALCNEPSRHRFFVHTDRALHGWAGCARAGDEIDRGLLEFARRRARPARGLRAASFALRCRREARRFRAFDLLLANSRYTAESLHRVTGLAAEICELGVPWPERPPARTGRATSPPLVALVSTGHPVKNLARSLAALGLAARRGAAFRLTVAGEGTDATAWRDLATRHGLGALGDRLTWMGGASDAALHALLEDAALLLYVPLDEPFGLLPLEALARGAAVVVSSHGGPAETIAHGATGWLVDAFSAPAIAEGVMLLLDDALLRSRLAAAGGERVRSTYSLPAFAERLEASLDRLPVRVTPR